jgi:hypothetical protein
MAPYRETKRLLAESTRLLDVHSALTRESFKAIRQFIRETARLETTSQDRIVAAHKLLDATSQIAKGYKPTKR